MFRIDIVLFLFILFYFIFFFCIIIIIITIIIFFFILFNFILFCECIPIYIEIKTIYGGLLLFPPRLYSIYLFI